MITTINVCLYGDHRFGLELGIRSYIFNENELLHLMLATRFSSFIINVKLTQVEVFSSGIT